jgi:hypothetical protein
LKVAPSVIVQETSATPAVAINATFLAGAGDDPAISTAWRT